MKFTILATVLLGLFLAPAFSQFIPNKLGSQQVVVNGPSVIRRQITINGGYQTLLINNQWRVATIEQQGPLRSWKTVWNYNNGFIATKVLPDRVCYVSVMNRMRMPAFDSLPLLIDQSRNLQYQGQPTRQLTFVVQGLITNLQNYGQEIYNMCAGLPTYQVYPVQGLQNAFNFGSCTRLDVLGIVELNYCRNNLNNNLVNNPIKV